MIFICYRREDSVGHTGRLFDRLVQHYGQDRVFMDLDAIAPGEDFIDAIQRRVGACEVELVVIGPSWMRAAGTSGRRRLDDPDDFVRLEVLTALGRNVRIIPVLVGGAKMPLPADLPDVLHPLARRQAFELPDRGFHDSVNRLIATIGKPLEPIRDTSQGRHYRTAGSSSTLAADLRYDLEIAFDDAFEGTQAGLTLDDGRRVQVAVPPGIDSGQRLRLAGEGQRGGDGVAAGDLYVIVTVRDSPLFTRQQDDLYCTMRLVPDELKRGTLVNLPRLGKRGALKFTVPADTRDGTCFRLAGKGMPLLRQTGKFGDLYVTVKSA